MKTFVLAIILAITLICCGRTDKENRKMTEMAIKDLELNEVVHDSLTPKQINDIKRIHSVYDFCIYD